MKSRQLLIYTGIFILLFCGGNSHADVRLPEIIANGAILQRDTPLVLWGWADDGEAVSVYLDGKFIGRTSTKNARWRLDLPPQQAGGPHKMEIHGANKIRLSDIYFGDLWLASGQSNMELRMERVKYTYADEIARADNPRIRQFTVPKDYDFDGPREDFGGGEWIAADREHISHFSAVAYFFAKSVQAHHPVPIGIIRSADGGSTAEGWMSEAALRDFPEHLHKAVSFRDKGYLQSLREADKKALDKWYAKVNVEDVGFRSEKKWYEPEFDDAAWKTMAVPGYWEKADIGRLSGAVWFRKTINLPPAAAGKPAALWLGSIVDADTVYVNGIEIGGTAYRYPPRRYEVGAGILKAGENTIAIRVLSLAGDGGFVPDKPYWLRLGDKQYDLTGNWRYHVGAASEPAPRARFVNYIAPLGYYNAMIAPLEHTAIKGVIWYQGESNVGRAREYARLLPALIADWRRLFRQDDLPFIFVQLPNFMPAKDQPAESAWAELREAQRQTLAVKNTAMAVTIDVGEWNDVHPLNKKVVGERLALAARNLVYGETELVHSGPLFRCMIVEKGEARLFFDHVGGGLATKGKKLRGFAVAGADGRYRWADAALKDHQVAIELPASGAPFTLRYAWADNPNRANLINREGLPAAPFESNRLCEP